MLDVVRDLHVQYGFDHIAPVPRVRRRNHQGATWTQVAFATFQKSAEIFQVLNQVTSSNHVELPIELEVLGVTVIDVEALIAQVSGPCLAQIKSLHRTTTRNQRLVKPKSAPVIFGIVAYAAKIQHVLTLGNINDVGDFVIVPRNLITEISSIRLDAGTNDIGGIGNKRPNSHDRAPGRNLRPIQVTMKPALKSRVAIRGRLRPHDTSRIAPMHSRPRGRPQQHTKCETQRGREALPPGPSMRSAPYLRPAAAATSAAKSVSSFSMPSPSWKRT